MEKMELMVDGEPVEQSRWARGDRAGEWELEGGDVLLCAADTTDGSGLPDSLEMTLTAASPTNHKLDFHWHVELLVGAFEALNGSFRPLHKPTEVLMEDGLSTPIVFRLPADAAAKLQLRLRIVRKDQSRLPIFHDARHNSDVKCFVHRRVFYLSPSIFRVMLGPQSPLLQGRPDWSRHFRSCGEFLEFCYHVHLPKRRVLAHTAAFLGRLAVRLNYPALRHKVCAAIRATKAPLFWRLLTASAAEMPTTVALIAADLGADGRKEAAGLVAAGLRMKMERDSFRMLLLVLDRPFSAQESLRRKALPPSDLSSPQPGTTVLSSGGIDFHVCRDLLEELGFPLHQPVATSPATLGALLHWILPEARKPPPSELEPVFRLLNDLGMRGAACDLETAIGAAVDDPSVALRFGLRCGMDMLSSMVLDDVDDADWARLRRFAKENWDSMGELLRWRVCNANAVLALPAVHLLPFPTESHTLDHITSDIFKFAI